MRNSAVKNDFKKTAALVLVIIGALFASIALSRWIDDHRPLSIENIEDEPLYVTGNTARRMSLAFNGLAADWYWMRSLQYVGRKIINTPEDVVLDDLRKLNLKNLPHLLDTATTLDPQFLDPYEYAAVVLPAFDVEEAVRITRKGIDANPRAWRLYQHLGYIYWQSKDFQMAADAYGRGSEIPGAPTWFAAMKARMLAEGGSRTTAREIYRQMFEQSVDKSVREMARRRLMQLDSIDEREILQKILSTHKTQTGRCPSTWKEVQVLLRNLGIPLDSSGAPLDPSGQPYILSECGVALNPESLVPAK